MINNDMQKEKKYNVNTSVDMLMFLECARDGDRGCSIPEAVLQKLTLSAFFAALRSTLGLGSCRRTRYELPVLGAGSHCGRTSASKHLPQARPPASSAQSRP